MVSVKVPVELIDGALTLRIPLADGGEELSIPARGLGKIEGDALCVVIESWVAQALGVDAGSVVVVTNANGGFHVSRSGRHYLVPQPELHERRERGRVLRFNNAKGTGRILSDEFHDQLWV